MTKIGGREITKNTMVGMSIGTLATVVAIVWTAAGIGRPLFASDLQRIEEKIDGYQTNTAVQILIIRREALESDLRVAHRYARDNDREPDTLIVVDEIEANIKNINAKILCYRTNGCKVEPEL